MSCSFYLKVPQTPPNQDDIKLKLSTGSAEERALAVKELVRCLVHDQHFPPMIMHVITNIVPIQAQSRLLQKTMMLYWEVIEKCKSPTDPSLKEEVFLACNSLRNDLISHNEYIRGRVLRLVSRIMHRGVIEPLASAISSNLQHKCAFVRRNAVVCLYHVHLNFGSDIIGEIDDEIEQLLRSETDLSTKRNAFLLLERSCPAKALEYLESQVKSQSVEDIGDILQLAILNVLRTNCKQNPALRPKLLKLISQFEEKASEAVLMECAITATDISSSASTIKHALSVYAGLLTKTNEINVKKAILDKLQLLSRHSSYLGDDLLQDLINSLDSPSLELRIKLVGIVMPAVTLRSAALLFKHIDHHLSTHPNSSEPHPHPQYLTKLLSFCELVASKFQSMHEQLVHILTTRILNILNFTPQAIIALGNILRLIFRGDSKLSQKFAGALVENIRSIESCQVLKVLLNVLASNLRSENEVIFALQQLKLAVGQLPLKTVDIVQKEQGREEKKFRTVVLEDGSYSSELVSASKIEEDAAYKIASSNLRYFLLNDCILGGVFVRAVGRLLYRLKDNSDFNKHGCGILMVLCSLYRHYQSQLFGVDQAVMELISLLIHKILDPVKFVTDKEGLFSQPSETDIELICTQKRLALIEKNPQDTIHFRLLHRGDQQIQEEDLNTEREPAEESFADRLKSVIQLTGFSDGIYAEAFLQIKKYDVILDILLINNRNKFIQNVQIEFSSQVPVLILEKVQSVNLRPLECASVRVQLRFNANEFGTIYGYINYDNSAGIEQPYIITQQLNIDYMQYLSPGLISPAAFDLAWPNLKNQSTYETVVPAARSFMSIVAECQKLLHAKAVTKVDQTDDYFLSCRLYCKSKLDEHCFINLSLFAAHNGTALTLIVRSQDKAIKQVLFNALEHYKFEVKEEEEE